jgi:hypothetical protein
LPVGLADAVRHVAPVHRLFGKHADMAERGEAAEIGDAVESHSRSQVSPSGLPGKRQRPSPSSSVSPVKTASALSHSACGSFFAQIACASGRMMR